VSFAAAALDEWLPAPTVRAAHRRTAAASPEALWRAAEALELAETRALGRLVRWRIPGLAPDLTFRGLLRQYPFVVLEEGEHHSLSGLCGRIWTLHRDYPRLAGAADFRAWCEPGTVRVLFGHWVEPAPDGGATLVSEARVAPVDAAAGRRLRALWTAIGPFERLIGAEPLSLAVRRAEAVPAAARP